MTRAVRVLVRAAASGALLVSAGCGSDGGAGSADRDETAATLTVVATDVAYDAESYEVPAGSVDITLIQEGQIPHTLAIEEQDGGELDVLLTVNADQSEETVTVDLAPGTYVLWCTIPGHRALGQEATLIVP
ncbi:MAG: cupredoxin domain-containing protein [Actinomycetota bacterium]